MEESNTTTGLHEGIWSNHKLHYMRSQCFIRYIYPIHVGGLIRHINIWSLLELSNSNIITYKYSNTTTRGSARWYSLNTTLSQ